MLKRSLFLMPSRTELYRAKLGVYLLIASLGMFFAASLITYVSIRLAPLRGYADPELSAIMEEDQVALSEPSDAADLPLANFRSNGRPPITQQTELAPLRIPSVLIISTILLVGISAFLHLAVVRVSQERQKPFRTYLLLAGVLAVAFMATQTYGLVELIGNHRQSGDGETKLYGIAFTLAFIHALHVYGGFIFLGIVVANAFKQRFDHERHWSVDICASYWHFLDLVWIAMLATFVITG